MSNLDGVSRGRRIEGLKRWRNQIRCQLLGRGNALSSQGRSWLKGIRYGGRCMKRKMGKELR